MKILIILLLISYTYSDILDLIFKKVDYQKQSGWGNKCNTGKQQSPINIYTYFVNQYSNKTLNIYFKDSPVKVSPNLDVDLRAKYDKSNLHLILDNHFNIRYNSKQYLLHAPSEHTINGRHLDLQFEFIYQIDRGFKKYTNNKYAVVSFLFRVVPDYWPKKTIFNDLDLTSKTQINLGTSLGSILPQLWFFNYQGSLSTPKCDEKVDRYVSAKVFQIKQSQYRQIQLRINNQNPNNRKLQRLRTRKIFRIKNTLLSQFHMIQSILKRPSNQYFEGKRITINPNFNALLLPNVIDTQPLKDNQHHINHIKSFNIHPTWNRPIFLKSKKLEQQIKNTLTQPIQFSWQYNIGKKLNEDQQFKIPLGPKQYSVGQHPALNFDQIQFSQIKQGIHLKSSTSADQS